MYLYVKCITSFQPVLLNRSFFYLLRSLGSVEPDQLPSSSTQLRVGTITTPLKEACFGVYMIGVILHVLPQLSL